MSKTDNTSGNAISVDLTTKVTASSKITIVFDADAPTTQDLTGVNFLSTVDDSATGTAAQSTTEGNGDGDLGDANSWKVTTTDVAGGDVYYSIGTSGADLKTGLPTLSIASGTATLTVAQTGNIGVGDEIDYDTGNKIAYIKSVISQTQFVVHTATGGVPGNVTTVTVNAIRRAFNTLASAEANSGNASHLTTFDLTATGAAANLTWVAYNDPVDFTTGVTIDGYTTDATHFITLTVAGASQVASATSQRHNGTAGTGVVLDGQDTDQGIRIKDDYTILEWFELKRNTVSQCVLTRDATNILLQNLLIYDFDDAANIVEGIMGQDNSSFTVRNSIIYDGDRAAIRCHEATTTCTVENVTLHGNQSGVLVVSGTATVTNTIAMDNTTDFDGTMTQSYNISSDATAAGTGSLINKVAADQFVNITAGSENLHLKAGADAIDTGTDLSGSFSDDIDGDSRPIGAQWDIGADETSAAGASLTLADHASGQVPDRFTSTSPLTDTLFQFELTRAATVTVDNVRVQYTTGSGVVDADVTNGELWEDTNGNGVIDGGDTQIQAGIAGVAGELTFTANFTPATTGTIYFVRATVANLLPGDTTTFSLGTADIDELEAVTESGAITNATHTQDVSLQTNYRAIGTAADYTTGTVTATNGSPVVDGTGTWQTANRGRGDRITIDGGEYTILSVDTQTQLTLTTAFTGIGGAGKAYTIARHFTTLTQWEDCISFAGCPGGYPFPPSSASLVADDRSEVGIAYKDTTFALSADVNIDGSITDSTHTITLTADGGNRHNGVAGAGIILDGQNGPNSLVVEDDNVTIEWLEHIRVRGANAIRAVQVGRSGFSGPTNVLLQNLLIHDFFDASNNVRGIGLSGDGLKTVTIRNCMIWDGDQRGIEADEANDTLIVENCSIDNMADGVGIHTQSSTVTVKNTIATSNPGGGFFVAAGSFSAASTNNTASDATAPGANPQTAAATDLFVAPNSNLHLKAGAVAINAGTDLSVSFTDDIDGDTRPIAGIWDRGADETSAAAGTPAVTSAVAEISPTDVATSSTGNAFSYDIQATISGGDTGVDRVAITVPGTFTVAASPVTDVLVGGSAVTFTDNTVGNAISVDLTTKVTTSSQITVLFNADAPTTQDLTGVAFLSTVDDSGTGDAAQSTTEGNGDGNAGDLNTWTVTTTDAGAGSLVGHWNFDEGSGQTAADSSGNGNDGTLGSTPVVDANDPAWACVAGGYALSFDGAVVPNSDYVDAGSASMLDDLGPMTVSAWIKPSTVAGEFYSTFVAKSDAAGDSKWIFEIDNTLPEVHAFEFNINYATTNLQRMTSDNAVSYDVWQHVTVTWDGSASAANIHIYKNGTELTYQTTQNGVGTRDSDAALPLIIGFVTEIAPPLPGLIDDVRIYDRVLSAAEITTLAASTPTDCGATPAVTSALAEISPNDVATSSTANAFSYDIQATIGGGDTGVNRVAITVPGTFTTVTVTDVLVGGVSVAFTDNTVGNAISVDLTTKVTASSQITVLFSADAPTTQDLTGVDFLSTVDDSATGDAAQSTTMGNGDGDAGDANSWSVTTTDSAAGVCPAADLGGWYPGGWLYRKPLSVGAGNVPSNLTNFPVLVSIPLDTELAASAQPDFDDILFTAADGTTKLSHEIEKYNATTGELVAWVKVPTVSSTADTILYMYYGNAGAANQRDPTGVWSNGYAGVWHLNEDPSGGAPQHLDSTSNNNDGTAQLMESGDSVTGPMDKALNFDPSTEYVQIPNSASLDITGNAITLSVWVKADIAPDGDNGFLTKYIGGNYNYMISASSSDVSNFRVRTNNAATRIDSTTLLPIGSWAYIVGTYDGTTMRVYHNAAQEATSGARTGSINTTTADVVIGRRATDDSRTFNGKIDEARVSNVARSADWITTEFSNQNDPANFHSVCNEEFPPAASAVTTAVAEISPNDVVTSSTANAFSYDIQAIIGGGDTGVDRVAITVPGSFTTVTVTDVLVGGSSVAFIDNTSGNAISVDLTTKVTASSQITVL
ncbi:MAG: DUF2341 domain-containing protein, partial [Gemmatimonadetes bacterium]|nr:DUF2341 domain-containing protein [Gemmatimonadota bacterium]